MSTTYPKSYVVERVEARAASIQAKLRANEARDIELSEDIDNALQGWTKQFDADLFAARSVVVINLEDARRAQELAKQAGGRLPGEEPVSVWEENPNREQQLTRRKRQAVDRERETRALQAELDAIDHVKAYLQGTPVDEFTLTQLKTLGLLEFVKFDLTRAKEQTR